MIIEIESFRIISILLYFCYVYLAVKYFLYQLCFLKKCCLLNRLGVELEIPYFLL